MDNVMCFLYGNLVGALLMAGGILIGMHENHQAFLTAWEGCREEDNSDDSQYGSLPLANSLVGTEDDDEWEMCPSCGKSCTKITDMTSGKVRCWYCSDSNCPSKQYAA